MEGNVLKAMINRFRFEWGLMGFLILVGVSLKFSTVVTVAFMGLLILTIGMPHGACDVFVIRQQSKSIISLITRLSLYLALAVSMYLLWQIQPHVFWILAFGLSLLHFLSIEWTLRFSGVFAPDLAVAALFFVPILKKEEFVEAMRSLQGEAFAMAVLAHEKLIFAILLGMICWRLVFFGSRLRHCVLLCLSMICFFTLPLWPAFLSFFLIIHSLRHLELSFQRFPQLRSGFYWRVLLPISALSMLPALWLFEANQEFLPRVAICLLCLTAPHFLLEEWARFTKSNRSDPLSATFDTHDIR